MSTEPLHSRRETPRLQGTDRTHRIDPASALRAAIAALRKSRSTERSKFLERREEAVRNNPDIKLAIAFHCLTTTYNPYFAWEAIDVCVKEKRKFPDWLVEYLGSVAEGMLSEQAKAAHDLRKVLPEVLGFDTTLGRGSLLNPDGYLGSDAELFALKFACAIETMKPPAALRYASDNLFDDVLDDKTLRKLLLKIFNQEKWHRSQSEWKDVARDHYTALWNY
jgi:hypothetical protein